MSGRAEERIDINHGTLAYLPFAIYDARAMTRTSTGSPGEQGEGHR